MGVSLSRIVRAASSSASAPVLVSGPFAQWSLAASTVLKLWYGHYTLNLIWAPIFFGLQKFRLGLIISSLLVLTLGMILPLYHAIDPIAAYLQLPYLAWLCFATVLNYQFCVLNPVDGEGVNEAMRQVELIQQEENSSSSGGGGGGEEYTEDKFQNDLKELQRAARVYAGL